MCSDRIWPYGVPGIRDEEFITGSVPMTKEEVRVIVLSKTRIQDYHCIYDIGAGTGSISVEAALIARKGKVFAVEQKSSALELIDKNREHFGLDNLNIVEGTAPQALKELPTADRIIIGGSGGNLKGIVDVCRSKLKIGGIVTLMAVTLNTLEEAQNCLKEPYWNNLSIVQIAVTRAVKAGRFRLLKALNPVFIINAERGIDNER